MTENTTTAAPAATQPEAIGLALDVLREMLSDPDQRLDQCPARMTRANQAARALAGVQAAPAAQEAEPYPHEQMDALALARYRVVPRESIFGHHAVVAGDGTAQVFAGREVECANMARKFAGAFLDGAFAFHELTRTARPAAAAQEAEPATGRWVNADDVDRLVREIDIAVYGSGAAEQAKLCDLAGLVTHAAAKAGRPLLQADAGAVDPWREHLAEQADRIDCKALQRAMVTYGCSTPEGGMEHFRASLGTMVNMFVMAAVEAAEAVLAARAAAPQAPAAATASTAEGEKTHG